MSQFEQLGVAATTPHPIDNASRQKGPRDSNKPITLSASETDRRREHNPIIQFKKNPTRANAIRAKCSECMGCSEERLETGFKESIRLCSSWACPLHSFRPYRANLNAVTPKKGHLETTGGAK